MTEQIFSACAMPLAAASSLTKTLFRRAGTYAPLQILESWWSLIQRATYLRPGVRVRKWRHYFETGAG